MTLLSIPTWAARCNQRVGQFIVNATHNHDLFYLEDDAIVSLCFVYYKSIHPKPSERESKK